MAFICGSTAFVGSENDQLLSGGTKYACNIFYNGSYIGDHICLPQFLMGTRYACHAQNFWFFIIWVKNVQILTRASMFTWKKMWPMRIELTATCDITNSALSSILTPNHDSWSMKLFFDNQSQGCNCMISCTFYQITPHVHLSYVWLSYYEKEECLL